MAGHANFGRIHGAKLLYGDEQDCFRDLWAARNGAHRKRMKDRLFSAVIMRAALIAAAGGFRAWVG
jgi:hypothetical protein